LKYISIGQFSKRTSLSIRALRLYDAEQLLQPSRVDAVTGYRYYTADQLGLGHLIRQLRQCEMPLDQLRVVLSEPQRARAELLAHKAHLEQRLADHQQMLESLKTLIDERPGELEVKFRSVTAQPVVLIRQTLDWATRHDSGQIGRGIAALQAFVHSGDHAGEPFLMYGCDAKSMGDLCICGPTKTLYQSHGDIEALELPATELAYTIHHGAYTTMQATLERLLRWILQRGFSVVGDAREAFLKHPANSSSVEEYRTELAIPVQRSA
jgi:DNA-binding transcriptional MerR regulator